MTSGSSTTQLVKRPSGRAPEDCTIWSHGRGRALTSENVFWLFLEEPRRRRRAPSRSTLATLRETGARRSTNSQSFSLDGFRPCSDHEPAIPTGYANLVELHRSLTSSASEAAHVPESAFRLRPALSGRHAAIPVPYLDGNGFGGVRHFLAR
jgi:hypothetical protein